MSLKKRNITCLLFTAFVIALFINTTTVFEAANPGDIFLSKTANQVPVACRTYEVTLRINGTPVSGYGNVDVAIVIDKSLSMSTDLNAVENIAKQLTNTINTASGNQVSIGGP
ncbi:hypothetical protein [Acetivibrio cellulolyticus]|uniref:hypothetical protein n=1 Tax=Acetivibrio cellulolyticus TaxID=35830 RepID=UPI0001E2EB57|nr:hypothetical protein [Acetivibrio cellulolyticus]